MPELFRQPDEESRSHWRFHSPSLTPLNEQRHQYSRPSRRYESDVALYNETGLNLARKHGARINDLHRSVAAAGSDRLLGPDGVHFTEEGYGFLAAAVASTIRSCLRGDADDRPRRQIPEIDSIETATRR